MWIVTRHEARVHAWILAAVLWTVAVLSLAQPGPRDVFGTLKGADFVHFYTLGDLGWKGDADVLFDEASQYERQVRLVPASVGVRYIPVNPPQTALIFAPFSKLPYGWAAVAWAALTVLVYGLSVRQAWRCRRDALPDGRLVALAAASFPPFWFLVLNGQTTLMPFVAFAIGGIALNSNRKFMAGLALGLLAVKPQLGLVLAVLALVCREGRLIAGVLTSVALQTLAAALVFGAGIWIQYAGVVRRLPQLSPMLEPKPYHVHSLRSLTALIPDPIGTAVWIALVAVVVWRVIRAWQSSAPIMARFGFVVIGSLLASPHLNVYDATVLALPLLWIGAWMQRNAADGPRRGYWALVYWLVIALLAPSAALIGLQASVVILAVIFWRGIAELVRVSTSAVGVPGITPADAQCPE